MWPSPAVIAVAVLIPRTQTGVRLAWYAPPSPSWPERFMPQHTTLPPVIQRAQVWKSPAAIAVVVRAPPHTWTGVRIWYDVCPSPSWPQSLAPQHQAVPSASTAQVWRSPATIAVAVLMPTTGTGVYWRYRLPVPSWPR